MTEQVYILDGYIFYEQEQELFRGSEEGLRQYIKDNLRIIEIQKMSGVRTEHRIAGFYIDDLEVSIEGPDIWSYVNEL